ncbi:MAG: hypothetical protein KDA91_01035 [Planctomycetaceae bacterium]|nr:hypothetical protein [Planctomycetaceae bacterium]
MFCFRRWICSVVILAACASSAFAEIEAVKGKRYTLSRQHGPWMIMVASLRDVEDEDRRLKSGMTAWEAADELVFELRKKGIPAYTFSVERKVEDLSKETGITGFEHRRIVAQQGYISVLACNFKSNQDEKIDVVLDYLKNKFRPQFLMDEANGGLFAKTPGRPGPLKPWVTVNPLLSPAEVKERTISLEDQKLILSLNSDSDYSLLKNRGKYTLVLATFSGNMITQLGGKADSKSMLRFGSSFGSNLDESAKEAWAMTEGLRHAKSAGYDQDYEAWLYHDRNRSYVTIGEFNSLNDPRIQTLATQFRAKLRRNPATGEEEMMPEVFSLPRNARKVGNELKYDRWWMFDGEPKLMEVPRISRK